MDPRHVTSQKDLVVDLAKSRAEVEALRIEVERLRRRLAEAGVADPGAVFLARSSDVEATESTGRKEIVPAVSDPGELFALDPGALTAASSPEEKIALFLNLFRGREDVFALR